ncbi:MAG: dihydroorotase [Bacteroidetes bacterium]|nr:dihydroorotase [Bacteroidota bacterium]
MKMILIRNASIVNEGTINVGDVLIVEGRIEKIEAHITLPSAASVKEIDATGLHLFPGCIDDQVHFREPGLTHKGDLFTESRAAVAGGITSFMEMPNTIPSALTQELLEDKYVIASKKSIANYSFFMGASNDNISEVLKTNPKEICGVKIFMGSSTGSMLVDNEKTLETIFSSSPALIATHCEDEATIHANLEFYKKEFGESIPIKFHPLIRSDEGCYKSSHFAVALAKKYNTRLHILHISTALETELFRNDIPLEQKLITSEACIHHLWFTDADYERLGNLIKWNPAIKTATDRDAIWKALLDNRIDVIATDHAPHTLAEKSQSYLQAPSGGPLVQHSLVAMLEFYHKQKISLERIAQKMAHSVARCFRIIDRGFIREGYFADLVLVDLNKSQMVIKEDLLYKCGWSPFEGVTFHSTITHTFVNGELVYHDGKIIDNSFGMRMKFNSMN